jgi:hypothetical protein
MSVCASHVAAKQLNPCDLSLHMPSKPSHQGSLVKGVHYTLCTQTLNEIRSLPRQHKSKPQIGTLPASRLSSVVSLRGVAAMVPIHRLLDRC